MNMLPPAIALFSAILKKEGHQVKVFDTTYYAVDHGIDSDGSKEQGLNVVPYQGTSLRVLCEEKKYLNKETMANIFETDSLLNMPSLSKKEIGGLVKTFPLYARLPRSFWKDIKVAESDTPEGNKVFENLITLSNEFNDFMLPNIFQLATKYIYLFVIMINLIYRFVLYRLIT